MVVVGGVYAIAMIVTMTSLMVSEPALSVSVVTTGVKSHVPKASMLTRGQQYDVTAGSKVFLDCEFHMDNFSTFDNPIVWEKQQQMEKTKLNIQGVVQEPFATTRRYDVVLQNAQAPRYRIRLKIKDVNSEDSGNYTCEVRGRKSLVLDKVVHAVNVRAPIKWVYVVMDHGPPEQVSPSSTEPKPLVSLMLTEGQSVPVRCVSDGGHPAPEITVSVDDRDITGQFETTHVTDVTGPRGLRTMHFRSSCWTSSFTVTSDDHGKFLRCTANVDGVGSMTSNVSLIVSYAPKIRCQHAVADEGDVDVELRCHVNARPSPTSLYWLLGSNGTILAASDDDVSTQYLPSVRDLGDSQLHSTLSIQRVTSSSFRIFTLRAENQFGYTTHSVQLVRKTARPKSNTSSAVADWSISKLGASRSPAFDQSELRMPASGSYAIRTKKAYILYATLFIAALTKNIAYSVTFKAH